MKSPDLKKVKAVAAGRSKGKATRNGDMQYVLWIGGSMGVVVVACVILVVNPNPTSFEILVNDPALISHVNRNARSWRAAASSFFEGWTRGDAVRKMLEGVSVSSAGGTVSNCMVPDTPVPDTFDSREKWPQCFNRRIYNMGNCTASWAIATASALSNRFCISSPDEYGDLLLSPQQLLSCDTVNRGCHGGDIDTVWNFVQRQGLVSETCFPYQADGSVSCGSRCQNEAPFRSSSHCVLTNEADIRREIYLNGPVVAPIFLIDDFLIYREGLYTEMPTATQLADARRQRVIHAVKIIGWGAMDGRRYWIIENSWGEDWGERGFAKVPAGGDPENKEGIVLETYIVAGTPASKKLGLVDDSVDLEDDSDLDGTDADPDIQSDSSDDV